jgi:hypothetical protein
LYYNVFSRAFSVAAPPKMAGPPKCRKL